MIKVYLGVPNVSERQVMCTLYNFSVICELWNIVSEEPVIGICEDYAREFHILFNRSKSKLMYYIVSRDNLHVKLCNQDVHIVLREKYIVNYICENIYDRSIKQTVCAFNAKSNQIILDFSMIDCFSLYKLPGVI